MKMNCNKCRTPYEMNDMVSHGVGEGIEVYLCQKCNKERGIKWHGWATPDQVREMMFDMVLFLDENKEYSPFISREQAKKIVGETIDSYL